MARDPVRSRKMLCTRLRERVQQPHHRGRQVDLGAALLGQRRGDREGAEQAGDHVAQRIVHVLSRSARFPREVREAAHGLEDAGEAGFARISRPRLLCGLCVQCMSVYYGQVRFCLLQSRGLGAHAPTPLRSLGGRPCCSLTARSIGGDAFLR